MNEPPSQLQLNEAFNKSHDLDPIPESWSLFAYSDAPPIICGSGTGSFLWFANQRDMIDFIRDYLSWWHPAPSTMEPEEIAAEVQAIVDAESADVEKMVASLNVAMRNMWQIAWFGQFCDLYEGEGSFLEGSVGSSLGVARRLRRGWWKSSRSF